MTPPEQGPKIIPVEGISQRILPEHIPSDHNPLLNDSAPLEETLEYGPPFTSNMDPENNHANGPYFITESTCNVIRKQLNLDLHPKSFAVRPADQTLSNPFQLGLDLAQSYNEYLRNKESSPTNKNGIHYQICQWLDKYGDNERSAQQQRQIAMAKNAAYIGVAVMINAFQVEWGYDFLDRLKEIEPSRLLKAFDKYPVGFTKNLAISERGQNIKRIPKHQAFLRELVENISDASGPLSTYIEDGAAAMYGVMEEIWPSLKNTSANKPQDA